MLSPGPRATRRAVTRLGYPAPVPRPNPIVVIWRWRYELGTVAGAGAAITAMVLMCGPGWTITAISGLASLICGWPAARAIVIARAWCVITPHRVRTGCAQAWIQSRSGKIPIVLCTTRQPFGERVLLWCRAGTSADDLIAARDVLAAACWASLVRATPDQRYAHLVALDVIRYAASAG